MPTRGLVGYRGQFLTETRGTGLMHQIGEGYGPWAGEVEHRTSGVLVADRSGTSNAYALFNLQDRGRLFIGHGEPVYEGMIVGIHSRQNDLVVNPTKAKQLTNIRAAGSDENILLTPAVRLSLEQALEFIDDDELVARRGGCRRTALGAAAASTTALPATLMSPGPGMVRLSASLTSSTTTSYWVPLTVILSLLSTLWSSLNYFLG